MSLVIPPVVSERAFERLAEINADRDTLRCLRVAVKGGGCSGFQYEITFDDPTDDDTVLRKNDQAVLIDSVSMPFLENAVIDFSEELIGARFVVNNPNAKSTCGCSLSFSI
ncbi:MAG: iron-sulfur cluster assembly accessory protein [Rhodobacteraceae bacterium]|nr:iron-sulfur cluster assembly accessory protein [Paracoccaceae bacterium]